MLEMSPFTRFLKVFKKSESIFIPTTTRGDLQKGFEESRSMLEDFNILFEALNTKAAFQRLFPSIRKFPLPQKADIPSPLMGEGQGEGGDKGDQK